MQRTLNFLFNLGDEEERKELSISFLVDLSGSMIGEPLEKVKEALISLLSPLVLDDDGASPGADQVNLFTFHSTVQSVSPWVNKEDFDFFSECLLAIDNLAFTGSGATALYDGINACLDSFKNEKLKKSNEKIIVVFSDGGENASTQNKRDIDLKIKAFANGYLEKDDMALAKNLDNSIRKRLFVSYRDDADILVFNDDALHLLNSGDL
ncbi:MAG: vWA domain-containing protein, partial [Candidatus Woesearchaeota archaeon]